MLARAALLIRISITSTILLIAAVVTAMLWDYYTAAPWTRNGQIRAQVANMAPRVSGQILEVRVHDNQYVHRDDVLYVIDPFDFKVKVDAAIANLAEQKADLELKTAQFERRRLIPGIAVSGEEKQQYEALAAQARAQYDAANAALRQARIDLERTQLRSSIDGYVTNLIMRPGDYASAGQVNIQIIDDQSYWVDGYFEETKVLALKVGDPVRIDLMGKRVSLQGHIESITRGIASNNAATATQGLPTVDPVYTWVRLAQRIPVRIHIDTIPEGLELAAGMTASITDLAKDSRPHLTFHEIARWVDDDIRYMIR